MKMSAEDYKNFVVSGLKKILQDGEDWIRWLDFASNTYKYSYDNSIAMYLQNPNIRMAADFTTWNRLNRRILKGQEGCIIFKDNKKQYVFDISQTKGGTVNRWELEVKDDLVKFTNKKYGINNPSFDDYLRSMIAFAIKDKSNLDLLFYSVKHMVSKRIGWSITSFIPNMYNQLSLETKMQLSVDTYETAQKILRKIEVENKELQEERFNYEYENNRTNEQSAAIRRETGVARESLPFAGTDIASYQQIEIRDSGDGVHGNAAAGTVPETAGFGRTFVDADRGSADSTGGAGGRDKSDNIQSDDKQGGMGETARNRDAKRYGRTTNNAGNSTDTKITITCEWSESPVFEDGKTYSVAEFDTLMKEADTKRVAGRNAAIAKYGSESKWYENGLYDEEFSEFIGYDKVKFTVNMPSGEKITERQDIGDGDGGVIDYFRQFEYKHYVAEALEVAAAKERGIIQGQSKDLQISLFPNEDEQIAIIDGAESNNELQRAQAFGGFYGEYNAVKETHPDDIVMFQVGDFFEMFGEDAKTAAEMLEIRVTDRTIPNVGKVAMCGVPAFSLEKYVEILQDKYDVTISAIDANTNERGVYTLLSVDHAADRAIDEGKAEYGAVGRRDFTDTEYNKTASTPIQHNIKNDELSNFVISDMGEEHITKSVKFKYNVDAIQTLKKIESEQRLATREEQKILSRYVGWGGLPEIFEEKHSHYAQLKSILTDAEYLRYR